MKYEVTLGGRKLRVDLGSDGRWLVDDAVVALDVVELSPRRHWSVIVDGQSHEIVVVTAEPLRLMIDGKVHEANVVDERAIAAARSGGRSGAHRRELRAPMPGLLKALHVNEGDVVQRGAPLATLEAMKMENELAAPGPAKIASIAVAAGTKIESGALIMVLSEVE